MSFRSDEGMPGIIEGTPVERSVDPAMRVLLIPIGRSAGHVRDALGGGHFVVEVARGSTAGLSAANDEGFDVVVVDAEAGPDGLAAVRDLRAGNFWSPLLLLGDASGVADRVNALRSGADDYLDRPFDARELEARVLALGRRHLRDVLRVGDIRMGLRTRTVSRAGRTVELTSREFDVLEVLVRNAGRVVSRRELYAAAWGDAAVPASNVVDVYVRYVREKVDRPFGRDSIETVRGRGYRFRKSGA